MTVVSSLVVSYAMQHFPPPPQHSPSNPTPIIEYVTKTVYDVR